MSAVWKEDGIIHYVGGIVVETDNPLCRYAAVCGDHTNLIKFTSDEAAFRHAKKFPNHLVQQVSIPYTRRVVGYNFCPHNRTCNPYDCHCACHDLEGLDDD